MRKKKKKEEFSGAWIITGVIAFLVILAAIVLIMPGGYGNSKPKQKVETTVTEKHYKPVYVPIIPIIH